MKFHHGLWSALWAVYLFASSFCAGDDYRFIHVQSKEVPYKAELDQLKSYLTQSPSILQEIKDLGVIRLVVDQDDKERQKELSARVQRILREVGIERDLEVIVITTDLAKIPAEVASELQNSKDPTPEVVANLQKDDNLGIVGDPRSRVKRAFKLAVLTAWLATKKPIEAVGKIVSKPTKSEIVRGLMSKSLPFGMSAYQYWEALSAHPKALAAAIGLSFALDTFHGIFVTTWMNVQDRIQKNFGSGYQLAFNWLYGQWWGACFRQVSYWGGKAKHGVLSWEYILSVTGSSFLSTIVGTAGYQGLNRLYQIGEYSRDDRAFRQQWLRDVSYMLQGTQMGLGDTANLIYFWTLFGLGQVLDFEYYRRSLTTPHRPTLFILRKDVIDSKDFVSEFPDSVRDDAVPGPLTNREAAEVTCQAVLDRVAALANKMGLK